ncbi:trehalase family glycosidase [Streptomyces sp. NPDC001508]|uniref:amylo-alpha-1,6-glucosidase n=1 Tax=Streptomyces sp. NPDC001508 TaxID=3154656 RepID=UPI00332650D5
MQHPAPDDWNTWDVRYHTAVVHPPSGIRIRAGIRTPDGRVIDDFTWRRGLVRLGHHTVDGGYAEVTVHCTEDCCGAARLRLRFAKTAPGVLSGSAELSGHTAGHAIVLRTDGFTDGRRPDLSAPAVFETPGELHFDVAKLRFGCGVAQGARPLDADLDAAGRKADAAALATSGLLGRAGEGYTRSLTWNTVLRSDGARVITPTSRDFVSRERRGFYGTWALHCWDTFFSGLTATWIDHDYARGIFGQMLEQATPQGFVPNRVCDDRGRTDDRSQPPVGAYTVLKAYRSTGLCDATRDRRLLTEAYDVLRDWHDWWPRARRGPHGLLAWGSDPTDDPGSATADSTKRESGMDDSPMWDEIAYDPRTHTMDLADVGLNALHAADAEAVADMAGLLQDAPTEQRLRAEHAATAARIEEHLWDEAAGHHRNLRADGGFDLHLAPSMLYPLLAGTPSAQRARRLAATLLHPELLGGSPPLPSVSRSDPGYDRHYMRGRVWGPVAFLAVEGLRRYGLRERAAAIADELLGMFRREWEEHSHVHENYPSGPDEDIHFFDARSDYLLTWGNLLAYLAMQELADPLPAGWRFGHPGRPAALHRLRLREGPLTVEAGHRLRVTLDGALLLDAPPRTVIEEYVRAPGEIRAVVHGPEAEVVFGVPAPAGAQARTAVRGRVGTTRVAADGTVRLTAGDGTAVRITL